MRIGPGGQSGQTISETILLMPLFLFLVFGVLQLGQLGVAVVVANYAASAAARQMVQDNSGSPDGYRSRFRKILAVGMKNEDLQATTNGGLLRNVTVHACAQVDAYPFIGQLAGGILSGLRGGGCENMGILAFNPSPPSFTVHGKAIARMNYQPQ
jgi:hypothetical protein